MGYADIESVAIMSLDQLKEKRTLVAKGSADLEQFDSTVQRMEKDQKPSHQGMVNVTFVSYVPGSSAMETVYKDKEQKLIQEKKERAAFAEEDNSIKENNLDKIINSLKEGKVFSVQNTGQRLPTCEDVNYIEKEFWIHKSEYSSLKERTLRTKIDKRIENCHEVGEVLPISVSNTPSKDKVKIISMHLLTLESLKANTNLIQGEEAQSKLNTNIERLEKELKDKEIKVIQLINVDYLGEQ